MPVSSLASKEPSLAFKKLIDKISKVDKYGLRHTCGTISDDAFGGFS